MDTCCGLGTACLLLFHRDFHTPHTLLPCSTLHTVPITQFCPPAPELLPSVTTKSPPSTHTSNSQSISVSTAVSLRFSRNPRPSALFSSCYYHQDPLTSPLHAHSRTRFSEIMPPPYSPTSATASAQATIPSIFPIPPVRSVRRNTFLSGCLPPWPPSNCLNRRKQFRHAHLGPLSLIKVHSSSHTMLTTVCPLATLFNNTFRVRLPYTRSLYCIAHSRRRCP